MRLVVSVLLVIAAGCGGDDKPSQPDAPPTADAFQSTCGMPGDMGNEFGIGHFCNDFNDCSSLPMAPLCSIIGDSTTHFCTRTCDQAGSDAKCGTDTTCTCNSSNQCGCTPNSCL